MRLMALMVTLVVIPAAALPAGEAATDQPNVSFIAVDDPRPELGCYGLREHDRGSMGRVRLETGEYGGGCKHTGFELGARVPLIVSAPSQKRMGTRSDALVEFVDLFPTLCDLGRLSPPKQKRRVVDLQGRMMKAEIQPRVAALRTVVNPATETAR